MTPHRILLSALLFGLNALTAAPPFTRSPAGQAVVSLRSDLALDRPTPLWLHLHGDIGTVEQAFIHLEAPGVLVTLTLPGLSKMYGDYFADPAAFAGLLTAVTAAVRASSPSASTWVASDLTVSSFSAGFGGVRQLLRQPAACDQIRTLVMADSIYCGYAGTPADRRIDPALMAGFVAFARMAAQGQKRLLITHSEQVPEGYASTTETADFLLAAVGATRTAKETRWTDGLMQISHAASGEFEVIGFRGAEARDHLQHLRTLGLFLARAQKRSPSR